MPRFVLLQHDHPNLHWDLMVEAGEVLQTWRLPSVPIAGAVLPATRIGDHRLVYLDYEGPVGGNRGQVMRWDGGEFEWLEQSEWVMVVRLRGTRLEGVLRLEHQEDTCWLAEFG
jgi:DNA polymerase ligase (LigD)-like protein